MALCELSFHLLTPYAFTCKIWCQSVQPLLRCGDFSIFQRWRPSISIQTRIPAINIIKLNIAFCCSKSYSSVVTIYLLYYWIYFNQSDMMQTKNLTLPVTSTSVSTMKYEVFIHNISQYLHMAQNKVIIVQLLLSWYLILLSDDFPVQFLYTLLNCMPYF